MKWKMLVAVAAIALASCGKPVSVGTVPAEQRVIYQIEGDLSAALALAVAYDHLPRCGANPAPCSDAGAVAKLHDGAAAAREAIYTAEALARAGSPAAQVQAAIAHARTLVSAVKALVP